MESRTVYFEKPGVENTAETLRVVSQRAKELGIKTVVVASTSGDTAVKAMDVLQGLKVIVVSHCAGFREPNAQEFTDKNRQTIESKGGKVLTATHAFAGLSRATHRKHNMSVMEEIMADTLRIFGQGVKVACEVSMMAADGGLVRTDEDIIAIAGTGGEGRGADTALVLKPVNSHDFFDLKVREILCKPHF